MRPCHELEEPSVPGGRNVQSSAMAEFGWREEREQVYWPDCLMLRHRPHTNFHYLVLNSSLYDVCIFNHQDFHRKSAFQRCGLEIFSHPYV